MSHVSKDEEARRILAKVISNDSKDLNKNDATSNKKEKITEKDGYQEYEVNDEKDLDDSDW